MGPVNLFNDYYVIPVGFLCMFTRQLFGYGSYEDANDLVVIEAAC